MKTVKKYCNYCKTETLHKLSGAYNKEGTGGNLTCTVCGSQKLDKIQGFNADLM